LNGIERSFDSYESKPRKRSVKSLLYCQEEVAAQYAEWLESQVGAPAAEEPTNGDRTKTSRAGDDDGLPFPRAVILEHLEKARTQLLSICEKRKQSRPDDLCETLTRAAAHLERLAGDFKQARRPQAEQLETSLTNLEKMLNEALSSSLKKEELALAREATAAQLQPYKGRMERATYEQTFDNLLLKRLRDQFELPRLSLFYL
jgi:hypothetical protein